MVIQSINIIGFGKLKNIQHNFTDGINVVYGKNEAGKSTTHSFIKAMLFGMNNKKSRNKLNTLLKYEPWEQSNIYEGYLTFSYKNKTYTIHRTFSDVDAKLNIKNDTEGFDVKNPELFLSEALCNLSETSFNNTISVGQLKSATEAGMISELHKYISNLNTSGDMSINTIQSLEYLHKQKEEYESKKVPDATMLYTKNLGNIRKLEKELSKEQYKNIIPSLQQKKTLDSIKIKKNLERIDTLEKSIENNYILLKQNGFENRGDIDTLKIETEKIYMEYEMLRNIGRKATRITIDIIMMIVGLLLGIFNTLILSSAYPQVASLFGMKNLSKFMPGLVKTLNNFPLSIAPLIGFFYAVSLILFISGFVLLISNTQTKGKIEDMHSVLSEVLNHQINNPVVSEDNMRAFKHHIDSMYNLLSRIHSSKEMIQILKKENQDLTDSQDEYVKQIQDQQRLQYEVEQKVNILNGLKTDSDRIKKDITLNDDLQKEIDSLDLAIDLLQELSSKVKVMFGTYLNEKASHYIDGLTNGIYNSLNVDDSLNITINTNNRIISLDQVSSGAMDQIYLAIRLATTDLIQGQSENLPLIFDDIFAMYDNERLNFALKWLYENYKRQVIIFTCHTREDETLTKNNIPFNKIEI